MCIRVAQKCATVVRCTFLCNSDAHSMKFTNSSVGMYNAKPLHKNVQRRTVAHAQMCTELAQMCTELAHKLVQFCTNLHALNFLAFKQKDAFTSSNSHRHQTKNTTRPHPIPQQNMSFPPLLSLPPLPPRLATAAAGAPPRRFPNNDDDDKETTV